MKSILSQIYLFIYCCVFILGLKTNLFGKLLKICGFLNHLKLKKKKFLNYRVDKNFTKN